MVGPRRPIPVRIVGAAQIHIVRGPSTIALTVKSLATGAVSQIADRLNISRDRCARTRIISTSEMTRSERCPDIGSTWTIERRANPSDHHRRCFRPCHRGWQSVSCCCKRGFLEPGRRGVTSGLDRGSRCPSLPPHPLAVETGKLAIPTTEEATAAFRRAKRAIPAH